MAEMDEKTVVCAHERHEFALDLGDGRTLLLCWNCLAALAAMFFKDALTDALKQAMKTNLTQRR
jgi:hypothetical protein